jgi:Ca2+-binding RTX toxin-like protein
VENVIGSDGGDTIYGDDGDNVIAGGRGNDNLMGFGGADTFVYLAQPDFRGDKILDFSESDGDTVDISAIDADLTKAGDHAFHFVTAFTGAGHAILELNGSGAYNLLLNVDDDLQVDMNLRINGHVEESAFVL